MIPALTCSMISRHGRECKTDEDFLDLSDRLAGDGAAILLASGSAHELSVRSIAVLRPVLIFSAKNGRCRLLTAGGTVEREADPLDLLQRLAALLPVDLGDWSDSPLLAGYVAYEAGRLIEQLSAQSRDELKLPDLMFMLPSMTIIHDRAGCHAEVREFAWLDGAGTPLEPVAEAPRAEGTPDAAHGSCWSRSEYLSAARKVREFIHEGEVYQVNLSQRFAFPVHGEPADLWRRLFAANPSPFAARIDAGDHHILCTSMERLFEINGTRIETRPIKGTRPRGGTVEEDERLAAELLSHAKDDAELSMIVDLERNDLGRICRVGSIRVSEHKRLERYANVQHLVSVVEGTLREGTGIAEVLRALFPGGSITGCPKIRAMEIIDELEPTTRHAYTGSIGYIANARHCDFNIAIRTAIVKHGVCYLSLGGGIVYDSDPLEEYMETLHKGRTFFTQLGVDESRFLDTK